MSLYVTKAPAATSSAPSLVTSLPGSPTDGQEVYYQSTTAGTGDGTNSMADLGMAWHLRYRSGSASTYKWEFLGGPIHSCTTFGGTSSTATGFFDLASGTTPSIVLARTGDYQVMIGAGGIASPGGQRELYMSVRATGYSPTFTQGGGSLANNYFRIITSDGNYKPGQVFQTLRLTGVSGTCKIQFACGPPYEAYYGMTFITVKPIRVI